MNICTNCKVGNQNSLFCNNCGHILQGLSYFEIFGLREVMEIEFQDLQSAYFKMQSIMHPDRFTNKSKEELQIAMVNSAIINRAYKVLSNKFECAQYLVSLHTDLNVKVSAGFMTLSFALHESRIEGNDIIEELTAMEAQLWQELAAFVKSADWENAAQAIAKLKIIARLRE